MAIATCSTGATPKIKIGFSSATWRTSKASSKLETQKASTSGNKRSTTGSTPWPYAFALTTAKVKVSFGIRACIC